MNVNFSVDLSNGESLDEAIDQLVLIREALYVTGDETETVTHESIAETRNNSEGLEPEYIPAPSGDKIDLHAVSYHQPPPAGVDVDKNGLPWDSRIHAGTKTKTAKDVWKRKKGVSDELVQQVEAELRQVMAAPAPVQSQFTPEELAPIPAPITNEPDAAAVFGAPTTSGESVHTGPHNTTPVTNFPSPPVENVSIAPPDTQTAVFPVTSNMQETPVNNAQTTAVTDFPGLLTKVTARISDPNKGAAFSTGMQQVLKDSGLVSIANLAARPDLVSTVDQKLDTLWNS